MLMLVRLIMVINIIYLPNNCHICIVISNLLILWVIHNFLCGGWMIFDHMQYEARYANYAN